MSGRLPHRVDFTLLQHLQVLIEQRSVSRAAERLGIGQPAMSRILARLRDQFDDPLLVRGPRGMMPTPRAEALTGPLRAWLEAGENLLRDPGLDVGRMKRVFRLASTDFGLLSVLTPALARIEHEAAGVELAVEPLSDASLRRLEDGRLDLVLTGWNPEGAGLKSRWLYRETHLGLARPNISRWRTAYAPSRRRRRCGRSTITWFGTNARTATPEPSGWSTPCPPGLRPKRRAPRANIWALILEH